MSEEKVTKYTIELHLVEIEVDADSEIEEYWEYNEVGAIDIEALKDFDDYDEARELFNDYKKQLV